jgi:hypothetical protein
MTHYRLLNPGLSAPLLSVKHRNEVLFLEGWAYILRLHDRGQFKGLRSEVFVRDLGKQVADDVEP